MAPGEILFQLKGNLIPSLQIAVSPVDVGGEVTAIHFKEGDVVKKEQILAVIRDTRYQNEFNSGEANYRAAFEAILADPDVHQLCVLFGTIMGKSFELGARLLADATQQFGKPVFALQTPFVRWAQSMLDERSVVSAPDVALLCERIREFTPCSAPSRAVPSEPARAAFGDESVRRHLERVLFDVC